MLVMRNETDREGRGSSFGGIPLLFCQHKFTHTNVKFNCKNRVDGCGGGIGCAATPNKGEGGGLRSHH
jgi:hypothetical protein